MDFLTKRTIFQCMASPAVMFTISASGKVTHKNSTVLTTSAKLSGKGICPILTAAAQGVPQPCKFQQTAWLAFDFMRKANGENLLTENSFCMCPIGSTVKVLTTNAFGYHDGIFSAPTAAQVAALQNLKVDSPKISVTPQISVAEGISAPIISAQKISENNSKVTQEIGPTSAKVIMIFFAIVILIAKIISNREYVLKCLNCDRKDCKYRQDKLGNFEVDKDRPKAGQKLRKHYEKVHGDSYKKFFADRNCDNAAHHLISFAIFRDSNIAELANACGYDINCAENCIILPTKNKWEEGLSDADKYAFALKMMRLTGMQWHLGNHEYGEHDDKESKYSFPKDEIAELKRQIKLRTGKENKVTPYSELVKAELRKIKIPNEGAPICPALFITRLNNISKKIREKLDAFKENPMKSHPFYVSREAYLYAFGLQNFLEKLK